MKWNEMQVRFNIILEDIDKTLSTLILSIRLTFSCTYTILELLTANNMLLFVYLFNVWDVIIKKTEVTYMKTNMTFVFKNNVLLLRLLKEFHL